jgi:hypothetical protein
MAAVVHYPLAGTNLGVREAKARVQALAKK